MKFSDVTKDDMKMFAQLIHMVQASKYDISGKDVCASADTIRFLQKVAVEIAKSYQAKVTSEDHAPAPQEVKAPPSGPLGEGVTIKAFHPGSSKPSKGKK